MTPAVRLRLFAALAVSLLAHFLLLSSTGRFWTAMPEALDFPIEASLELPPPAPAPAPARPQPRAPSAAASIPPVPAAPEPVTASPPGPEPTLGASIQPEPAPAEATLGEPGPPPAADEVAAVPAPPLRRAVRQLARPLEIKYAVVVGEDGFTAGQAVYIWRPTPGRYSLVSTIQATGLTALFIPGSIIQVSEGRVDGRGLQPEQYLLRRGERRQETARFLWAQNRIDLGRKYGIHELTPEAQDLLSWPFHLAMTAREDEPDFSLGVTNGRRFSQYGFRSLGRKSVEVSGRSFATLHLQGGRAGEGSIDVWLDREGYGLPVKVRTQDLKGQTMMLVLEAVSEARPE
jgi:hypothetical protein